MKIDTRRRISNRTNREDGDATKARIVESAGQLFAEQGYADTTSKEICERASVSITSVNYHFGSRDALYLEVLQEMHDFFSSPHQLTEMEQSDRPPREKLGIIMGRMVKMIFDHDSWQIRLWAREMLSPTELGVQAIRERGHTGIEVMLRVLEEITGLKQGTPELKVCFVCTMSPFIVLLLKGRRGFSPHKEVFHVPPEETLAKLQQFIFAGLDAFTVPVAERK